MPSGASVAAPSAVIHEDGTVARPRTRSELRPDIQGLRMVAVVAVVLDHLFAWPSGGFVGVDVFFVISGFLITGLLLREHDRSGTISFTGFYKRRVRRIVPAATVTLLVTTALAFLVFNFGRATQTLWDAIWSFFFVGNWHFAIAGTDYFTAGGPVSPLQHFWSLSVEEQFYFVWPWLMLLIFFLGGRAVRWDVKSAHRAVGVAMIVIVVTSFAWSMWETANNPTWAYFSTLSRTWELGVGALLGVFAARMAALPALLRPILGWIGLLGILASIFLINDSMPFPGPWAAAPVLSTALVILAGTGGPQRFMWPLTNPVSGWVGNISYSLYLWHFPVIVLLASLLPAGSLMYVIVAVVVMMALSVASYYLIEQTVLKSTWLREVSEQERRQIARRRRSRGRSSSSGGSSVKAIIGVALIAVVVLGLSIAALAPKNPTSSGTVAQQPDLLGVSSAAPPAEASTPASELSGEIAAALNATAWPAFDPPVDGSVSLRVPQWVDDKCLNVSDENVDRCVYGSASPTKTAVVLGDSVGTSWLPGLISGLEPLGYQVRSLTYEKCPFGAAEVTSSEDSNGPLYERCVEHHDWVAGKLADMKPDLIIISDSFYGLGRLISRNQGSAASDEWSAGFGAALDALPSASAKVVLMSPPGAKNMMECYTPISQPSACTATLRGDWTLVLDAESSAAKARNVPFVDTQNWFCWLGKCPSFVGTTGIYADSAHLTTSFSTRLGPVIVDELRAQLVLE